ncbi:glycoside hydrolase family 130 protein [Flavihumibacter fluvii]|uniref:glycoside hydrolase family 130 protein n=1 Tax=Flavihumibacter fluvii TaxID=2838157 RepID=UPI001BDE2AA1|nr:glycoside hydrolase family 130 protein [Flavihumibacter fluvii]ULQ51501.1 glycoside hydrolase family 130 protein [Flavihumibacter fluvii]
MTTRSLAKWAIAGQVFLFVACSSGVPNEDWMLTGFEKVDSVNPCLQPGTGTFEDPILKRVIAWENKDVFNPAAIVRDGKVYLLYRAEDTIGRYAGTSRIGLAESSDGIHFTRRPAPVLFPAEDEHKQYEWEGGCEDPRIVMNEAGRYFMTYTTYDGTIARLFVASSDDLVNWTKHGSVFKNADGGKYLNHWSKSGAIICRREGDQLVATKINGKYWMYWGDSNIYAASSDDLVNWTPVQETDPAKKQYDSTNHYEAFKIVLAPRPGRFDSRLVESGPPAMVTEKGILFIYNSMNSDKVGDTSLPKGTYAAGQVLIDPKDPTRVISRSEDYFFKPDRPFEITGQVNNVCFLEGLVHFKDRWYLYYGTADSKIAVAVSEQ